MRVWQKQLTIKTKKLYDFVKLTDKLQRCVEESKIKNGVMHVCCLHNTAALLIQEDDASIFQDLKEFFERILPINGKYKHSYEGSVNATAHQKSMMLKNFLTLPISNGKLVKGYWQDFWLVELFEPRKRKISITIIGSND